jgi:para-nitrobenzyl esterase
MQAGGAPAAMQALADQMQDAWIAFARTGNPSHPGLPAWPRYEADQQVMLFDAQPPRVPTPPAARWRHWP